MAADFSLGQNDNNVPWAETIRDDLGNPIDITGATVSLHLRIEDASAPALDRVGSVVGTTPNTKARYLFLAADTGAPGIYRGNWIVTLVSGERITFPSDRRMMVEILAKT